MSTLIDARHLSFVLWDVLDADGLFRLPAFAHHDRASAEAMLRTAEQLARDVFAPCFARLDAEEPRMENGRAVLPPETAAALSAFREAGFHGMAADVEDGGLGLPRTVANAAFLWFQAANVSVANYAMLTMSAAELLARHGSPEQKARWMAPMLEGRFLGTMALSEPHAGSSLGDITTTARPLADGRYAIRGTKTWISGGEHDMAENIVHLMLARIEGAPKGVRGISLFVVPRRHLDADGRPTAWNHVALAGLNHKMGQRGTINTVLSVGEGGDTIGEIVGEPGQGLACMFTMMNEARIGVSMGAVAHASAGFRHSLAYARERLQGRHPDSRDPSTPQVPIIEHADVRRMLLAQKVVAEGGIALGLLLARLADLKKAAPTAQERADAGLLLDLMTPVFKAWMSEECLAANSEAMQVLGGAGYTRDHPLEQHYRDNRLNPIHEGTNGIQAIDLLGRKMAMEGGRAVELLADLVRRDFAATRGSPAHAASVIAERGLLALEQCQTQLAAVRGTHGTAAALVHARDVMEVAGCTMLAWAWRQMAWRAVEALDAGRGGISDVDRAFYEGKIAAAEMVRTHWGPRIEAARRRILDPAAPPHLAVSDAMLG